MYIVNTVSIKFTIQFIKQNISKNIHNAKIKAEHTLFIIINSDVNLINVDCRTIKIECTINLFIYLLFLLIYLLFSLL